MTAHSDAEAGTTFTVNLPGPGPGLRRPATRPRPLAIPPERNGIGDATAKDKRARPEPNG